MTKVLLLGAGGMLAQELIGAAPPGTQLVARSRSQLDVVDADAVAEALDREEPRWVINASAYTRVDRAEGEYDLAHAVNATAVTQLGASCAKRDVRVAHFSTDYVFGGDGTRPYREDDPVNPVNAYGRSKLAGEEGLERSGARSLILRTQWLYGLYGPCFPRTMWDRATRQVPTRVVMDQIGRPTSARDLARVTWALLAREATGRYHATNTGDEASWFDVASAVFDRAGMSHLLASCTTADYPTPAARPRYSVLDTSRLAADHGLTLPPWRDSLAEFLEKLATAHPITAERAAGGNR